MKRIYDVARRNALWDGIGYADFEKMLHCLDARTHSYSKGDFAVLSGNAINRIGLILSGSVKIIKEDADGNVVIIAELAASEMFGEVFVCAGIETSPVSVQASENSEVLFIDYQKVIAACPSACGFHLRLIENMLKVIAKKNLALNQKIEILAKRTMRDKLLLFLDMQRGTAKKFTIPFNREELAHYLCVDRSALSKELCRMREEGLIRFQKNAFEMPERPAKT